MGIENVSTLLSVLRYYGTWRGRRQHCDFNLDSEGHLLWLLASLSSFRAEKNRGKTLLCHILVTSFNTNDIGESFITKRILKVRTHKTSTHMWALCKWFLHLWISNQLFGDRNHCRTHNFIWKFSSFWNLDPVGTMRGTWVLVVCLTNIPWTLGAGGYGYVPGVNGTLVIKICKSKILANKNYSKFQTLTLRHGHLFAVKVQSKHQ